MDNKIHEEPEEVMQKELEESEIETVEETNQVLEKPEQIPEKKVAEPEIMEPRVAELELENMKLMESSEERETKKPSDEIHKVEEETKEAAQQSESSEDEEEKITHENYQAEDIASEQLEDHVGESLMEPEPDQEPKDDETQTQQQLEDGSDNQQVYEENGTENVEGAIGEETDEEEQNEGDMDATSPAIDADERPIEGAPMEEDKPKKSKLRKPLMFAGSAFLATLIVLVINSLRERKR